MRVRPFSRAIGLLAVVALTGASLGAHHSFASVYDQQKPLRVQGVVAAVNWANPHVTMTLVAKQAAGEIRWEFEMGAPGVLISQFGWTQQTVQVGDTITIDGFRARDGGQRGAAWTVTTKTGTQLRAVRPFR